MNNVKLSELSRGVSLGEFKRKGATEIVSAFQVRRPRASFHGLGVQVVLPDIMGAGGEVLGQGGRLTAFDGDWICKTAGSDYVVVKDEVFAQDYERV